MNKTLFIYEKIFFSRNRKSIQFDQNALTEPRKYKDAIDAIKKDIAYMPIELKKLKKKILFSKNLIIALITT